jgi:hypothetical protein
MHTWCLLNGRISSCSTYHAKVSLMKLSGADQLIGGTRTSNSVPSRLLKTRWNSRHGYAICRNIGDICAENSAHGRCSVCGVCTSQYYCCIVLLGHIVMLLVGALRYARPRAIRSPTKWISLDDYYVGVLFVSFFEELYLRFYYYPLSFIGAYRV